jgi:putative heme-binding domain-containing protein
MDNPTKIAFTDEGEALCGVNIIHGTPKRIDGIFYALEGAVFPYYKQCVDEFKSTGSLFEPVDNLGWVAISGIVRNRGAALGDAYRGNLFSCQFNQHRLQRHIIERDGAGFRLAHEDFLTCPLIDFHPTDVIEDADGSLLVINTGGWFRVGCPNSQIAKAEIKGCIYRVRRTNAPKVDDPRGLNLAWETMKPAELAHLLDDARPFVRDRAIASLAKLQGESVASLRETLAGSTSIDARRNALWALTRIDDSRAREAICAGLSDANAGVRQVAVSSIGLHRDASMVARLIAMVGADVPQVRRDAATALGRIGQPQAAPALLAALRGNTDRFLEHSLIFALIRIGNRDATLKGLADADPSIRRGALIALDQMNNGGLTADLVTPLLSSPEPSLQSMAAHVISGHLDWGGAMEGYFRQSLKKPGLNDAQREELKQQIAAFGRSTGIQTLVADGLKDSQVSPEMRALLLEAIAQSPVDPLPAAWQKEITRCIEDPSDRVAGQAAITARAAPGSFEQPLLRIARDANRTPELRIEALASIAPKLKKLDPSLLDLLIASLDPKKPPLLRSAAAAATGRAHLDSNQQLQLTAAFAKAGPLEVTGLLAAFEHGTDAEVGKKLVAALDHSPGSKNLRLDVLTEVLQSYPPEVQQAAEPLLKRLSGDILQQKSHLDELMPTLAAGDQRRGRDLFFGSKAACVACHAVADQGAHVGPDLSKIGGARAPRDLLESVVYPSASFARGLEPYLIKTKDGDVESGLISQQTADAIYLVTGPKEIKRIARARIADIRQGTVSIMPQGFDTTLTRQELADLIAYLSSLK